MKYFEMIARYGASLFGMSIAYWFILSDCPENTFAIAVATFISWFLNFQFNLIEDFPWIENYV